MNMLKTLMALNACFGPSGQEKGVARRIEEFCVPYADRVYTDTLGNLIAHKKGPGARVMLSAHMDSIGFMVTHIEENGFLRVGAIGGVAPGHVLGVPVRFQNGAMGTVFRNDGLEKAPKLDDLFIDVGAADRGEAKTLVDVGDAAVYATPTFRAGEAIVSPYLDNRVSCVALLMALESIKSSENDLYFVFSAQEEVGLRGAQTAAYHIAPDYALALDVTVAGDLPGSKHSASSRAGGGAAIKVMDRSVICHPALVRELEALAKAEEIPYQMDVITAGGTDAGVIHKSRGGVVTGGVSIPCRYTHTPAELVYERDVEAVARLVTAFCEKKLEPIGEVKE